jgi:hypothetical protein
LLFAIAWEIEKPLSFIPPLFLHVPFRKPKWPAARRATIFIVSLASAK